MYQKHEPVSVGMSFAVILVIASAIAMEEGLVTHPKWYGVLWITLPLLAICGYTEFKKQYIKHKQH